MNSSFGRVRYGFTRAVTNPTQVGRALSSPNYGLNTGAPRSLVLADRQALADSIGAPVVWMNQIHSDIVCVVGQEESGLDNSVTADAVITRDRVALAVQVADCVPVLLFDKAAGVVAAVHAGRAGAKAFIVAKTVSQMTSMGCSPRNIKAVVGPSICGACYEVGEDVFAQTVSIRPEMATQSRWGTRALDVRAAVLRDLEHVGDVKIDDACTLESDDLNSYRRNPKCGRQVGWVVLD